MWGNSCYVYVKFEMPVRDLRRDVKETIEICLDLSEDLRLE